MQNWIVMHSLPLVLPMVLGVISKYAVDYMKQASKAVDALSPFAKQGLAIASAFVLTGLGHFLGSSLPVGCLGDSATAQACLVALQDPGAMTALLGGLVAIAMKHGEQNAASPGTTIALVPVTGTAPVVS